MRVSTYVSLSTLICTEDEALRILFEQYPVETAQEASKQLWYLLNLALAYENIDDADALVEYCCGDLSCARAFPQSLWIPPVHDGNIIALGWLRQRGVPMPSLEEFATDTVHPDSEYLMRHFSNEIAI